MEKLQTTLKQSFSISGVGLHTGIPVTMTFLPAPEDHGYKFQRIDLEGQPIIEADADLVTDVSRGTTLEKDGAKVSTVEHVLAALVGLEIDNVLMQLDAVETPIMDGSSMPYVERLRAAGIVEQKKPRIYFEVPSNIAYAEPERGVEMIAMPLDDYRLTVMIDYNSPVLGSQHASISELSEFADEIASCRTFCFLHELEMLLEHDLIKGGDLNNAIVVVDRVVEEKELEHLAGLFNKPKVEVKQEGILNNVDLRFQNEPARHKLLDLIGDLALVGRPIKAQIMAARPGHAANVAFARKIKRMIEHEAQLAKKKEGIPEYDPNAPAVYTYQEIERILPHKFPFLLVDKIVSLDSSKVIAIKNITGDQYFFQGHFPGEPLMPGVLQLEAMAQAGGVLVLHDKENPDKWSTYFVKIENAKFKGKVIPGDTLIIKMELMRPIRRGLCLMHGEAFVGDRMVCEADMMAQIVENK
ncbi:MAG: bifunctional UDP-3-O-[3-hydroxymyristoyl] N-acetylglucosamine deacetylase/3-hydroxyacyl-ACP dehydratase [Flavobacteriales bacterium]|nr:bifunctional UDP-3-O-[3-hydroxymyristoyl] N-acetylglucosamine deacetylase/3-hydroxyacyl-ACP dehydratase [Flavobacteriales bacterium]